MSNSKRIAQNTISLYIRMVVTTLVAIYASRVILDTLGVADFGIYNIVGGIVILFSFISSSMNAATQRYLNVAMGKGGNDEVRKVFSNSLFVYVIFALLIFAVTEVVGLWFLENKLSIPMERMEAAIFVFHFSVASFCLNILATPYNAMVIAYERMSFYAYSSLLESGLKLAIVWLLPLFAFDKLKLYAVLVFVVVVLVRAWYYWYCRTRFSTSRFVRCYDQKLVSGMMKFSGWNLLGGLADIGFTQGSNFILNIFHGVTLNAALGLANQVRSAMFTFVTNLQVAANPQIIKSYVSGDESYFCSLVYNISKYSYFLILLVTLPVICNAEYILSLWLVETPAHTANFLVLVAILIIFDSFHGPLWTAMQANGNLKQYQVVMSVLLLLNLPVAYIVLYVGYPPESILIVQIVLKIIVWMARLVYAKRECRISLRMYLTKVIYPVLKVSTVVVPLILYVSSILSDGIPKLLLVALLSVILICLSVFLGGIDAQERHLVCAFMKKRLNI